MTATLLRRAEKEAGRRMHEARGWMLEAIDQLRYDASALRVYDPPRSTLSSVADRVQEVSVWVRTFDGAYRRWERLHQAAEQASKRQRGELREAWGLA